MLTVLAEGHAPEAEVLLHALVAEVRVQSRHAIQPVFRVPIGGVRILDRVVGPRWTRTTSLSGIVGTLRLVARAREGLSRQTKTVVRIVVRPSADEVKPTKEARNEFEFGVGPVGIEPTTSRL